MKIFIGCSASNNISDKYFISCKKLLDQLLSSNDLVFGACNSGIMALAHEVALENNRKIIGVCPEVYKHDFSDLKCDNEIITTDIISRTSELISNSDALVFLPGGIGSIYELFTAIESKRCHEFDKPIVIYNYDGYYNKLFEFLDNVYDEKFARVIDKENYFITDDVYSVLEYIKSYDKVNDDRIKVRKK